MVYNITPKLQQRDIKSQLYVTDNIVITFLDANRDKSKPSFLGSIAPRTEKDRQKSRIILTLILIGAVIVSYWLLPESFKSASLLFACPILTQLRKLFKK